MYAQWTVDDVDLIDQYIYLLRKLTKRKDLRERIKIASDSKEKRLTVAFIMCYDERQRMVVHRMSAIWVHASSIIEYIYIYYFRRKPEFVMININISNLSKYNNLFYLFVNRLVQFRVKHCIHVQHACASPVDRSAGRCSEPPVIVDVVRASFRCLEEEARTQIKFLKNDEDDRENEKKNF